MKAFAIGRRLAYKDYVDWYTLLKNDHVSLSGVIDCAEKKFGGDFNARLFLGQLVSFNDVPPQSIDFLRKTLRRKTIEQYLERAVRKFME